ncbi:MAG: hypothetical protein GOMPHAMPRED_001555 [Gomphillus americanus]|uniref:Uncharacterized protein n=1 Tax=Gomphillus americanus TaxID=1940652 RepID=A0A8H3IK89_9LECA|nr:MAG: hypothetical protein GOMPHAMPRED_001555 [Gomphillus americanus]
MRLKRKKDAAVHSLTELEQTEIPALQAHCRQLTVLGQTAACIKFLTNISHLANFLARWASSDGSNNHSTPEQRANEEKFLTERLQNPDDPLERLTKKVVGDLATEMESSVVEKSDAACHSAENKAIETSNGWGLRPDRRVLPQHIEIQRLILV